MEYSPGNKVKHLIIAFTIIINFSLQALKSKVFQITDFKGSYENIYLNQDDYFEMTPLLEEMYDADVISLWKVLPVGNKVYVASGNKAELLVYEKGNPQAKTISVNQIDKKSSNNLDNDKREMTSITIDDKGRVYFSTGPKGEVYYLQGDKPQFLCSLPVNFIWDLKVIKGELYAATGSQGGIYKINIRTGKYEIYQKLRERNVLKLYYDNLSQNLYASTAGRGYLYVLSSEEVKIIADMDGREINDFLVLDRYIYLVTSGKKVTIDEDSVEEEEKSSHYYNYLVRVNKQGGTRSLFQVEDDAISSLVYDDKNQIYFSTSRQGQVYRYNIENEKIQKLFELEDALVTDMEKNKEEIWFCSSINGKIYRIRDSYPEQATLYSGIIDLINYSQWGHFSYHNFNPDSPVHVWTRTGNTYDPSAYWSDWEKTSDTLQIQSPNARFIQFKLDFESRAGQSPIVDKINIFYGQENKRPKIIEFDKNRDMELEEVNKISLKKEELLFSWKASDEDKDRLKFKLEYQLLPENENNWILIDQEITKYFSVLNRKAFPSGIYRFRLTASDELDNYPQDALTDFKISSPQIFDNEGPKYQLASSKKEEVNIILTDNLSIIANFQYTLDHKAFINLTPVDGLYDETEEYFTLAKNSIHHIGKNKISSSKVYFRARDIQGNETYFLLHVDP